jgi:hypothetical protein
VRAPEEKEAGMATKTAKSAKTAKTAKSAKTAKIPAPRTGAQAESAVARTRAVAERGVDLSEDVIRSLESGQRAAIEAVRKFVDTLDEALPAVGGRPSRREKVIDAALEMADRLVTAQYDFLHTVVRDAGRALSQPTAKKKK